LSFVLAILAGSFRVVTARLIPLGIRPKQASLLLASLILAGCGGSGHTKAQQQVVTGPGFRFAAPAGWTVSRTGRQVSASQDSELVQVSTFRLVRPYTPKLFERVDGELASRMRQVANTTGGKLTASKTVTAGGIRSHAYDVTVGDHVDQYTFVLRGMREYQLLCRRLSSHGTEVCDALIASFRPA
jgi:hypothetical protein